MSKSSKPVSQEALDKLHAARVAALSPKPKSEPIWVAPGLRDQRRREAARNPLPPLPKGLVGEDMGEIKALLSDKHARGGKKAARAAGVGERGITRGSRLDREAVAAFRTEEAARAAMPPSPLPLRSEEREILRDKKEMARAAKTKRPMPKRTRFAFEDGLRKNVQDVMKKNASSLGDIRVSEGGRSSPEVSGRGTP